MMKACTGCLQLLQLTEFGKQRHAIDGLRHRCFSCNREAAKAYRERNRAVVSAKAKASYQLNKDVVRAKHAEYRRSHAEVLKTSRAAHYQKNRQTLDTRNREWIKANRERRRQIVAAWQKRNPLARIATEHRRRALKAGSPGHHGRSDIERIRRDQRDRCGACRTKLRGKGHVDHIQALSRGGSNLSSNLQLLCERCNTAKGARHPTEFMQSRGFLL